MNGVVTDTSFSGNSTKGDGAGLYVSGTETVSLSGCPVVCPETAIAPPLSAEEQPTIVVPFMDRVPFPDTMPP